MRQKIMMAALLSGLSACSLEPVEGMALKCQITKCVCLASSVKFPVIPGTDTKEVLWRDNGDAYCAEGYVLREDTDKK